LECIKLWYKKRKILLHPEIFTNFANLLFVAKLFFHEKISLKIFIMIFTITISHKIKSEADQILRAWMILFEPYSFRTNIIHFF